MVGGSAAAPSNDINQSVGQILFYLYTHLLGRLIVFPKLVGQPGIGICTDVKWGFFAKFFNIRFQIFCPKSAVQTDRKKIDVRNGVQECLQCLSRQCTSGSIGNSNGNHNRKVLNPSCFQLIVNGYKGGFGIQRVEYRLHKEHVHPTVKKSFHLGLIGIFQVIESYRAVSRVIYIRRHGCRFVGRAHRTCHEPWFFRC